MPRYSKRYLIENVATDLNMDQDQVATVINATLNRITSHLGAGSEINLHRFGTFRPVVRRPRQIKSPRTGEVLDVPARLAVRFKPSKHILN